MLSGNVFPKYCAFQYKATVNEVFSTYGRSDCNAAYTYITYL